MPCRGSKRKFHDHDHQDSQTPVWPGAAHQPRAGHGRFLAVATPPSTSCSSPMRTWPPSWPSWTRPSAATSIWRPIRYGASPARRSSTANAWRPASTTCRATATRIWKKRGCHRAAHRERAGEAYPRRRQRAHPAPDGSGRQHGLQRGRQERQPGRTEQHAGHACAPRLRGHHPGQQPGPCCAPAACSRRSIPPCARWTPTCPTACRTLPVPCRT